MGGKAKNELAGSTVGVVVGEMASVQCDEIWSFTYAKQKNVATAKAVPVDAGDTWTWTTLDTVRDMERICELIDARTQTRSARLLQKKHELAC